MLLFSKIRFQSCFTFSVSVLGMDLGEKLAGDDFVLPKTLKNEYTSLATFLSSLYLSPFVHQ